MSRFRNLASEDETIGDNSSRVIRVDPEIPTVCTFDNRSRNRSVVASEGKPGSPASSVSHIVIRLNLTSTSSLLMQGRTLEWVWVTAQRLSRDL